MECAGTLVPVIASSPWLSLVMNADALPETPVMLTVAADAPVFKTCTATEPSVFLKADVLSVLVLPPALTRTAPGLTKRLHCAIAQKRLEGATTPP